MQAEKYDDNSRAAFVLTFFTFFLDNVLLTVVVPMLAPWVQPEAEVGEADKSGRWAAAAGAVLGAKAGTQLLSCAAAATAVAHAAPPRALRAGTALLLASSGVLSLAAYTRGALAATTLLIARVLHGAGAALTSVAGWALVARRPRQLQRLLPALALGVVVGYVLGTVTEKGFFPFALIGAALAADLALQYKYLANEDYRNAVVSTPLEPVKTPSQWSRNELIAAGAVFVSTWVVATLEPCLPAYLLERGHTQCGLVFVADSAGYLCGGWRRGAGAGGAARGLLAVAAAAAALPATRYVWQVCATQFLLGFGIGTIDAALFPAVIGPDSVDIDDNAENNNIEKLSLTPEDKAILKDIEANKIEDYKELYYNNDIIDSKDESDYKDLKDLHKHENPLIQICTVTPADDEGKIIHDFKEKETFVRNKSVQNLSMTKESNFDDTAGAVVPATRGRDARSASRAALLHAAASAACAAGGVAGSLCAWWASLDRCLLALAAANALYALLMYSSAAERKPQEPRENSQLIAAK